MWSGQPLYSVYVNRRDGSLDRVLPTDKSTRFVKDCRFAEDYVVTTVYEYAGIGARFVSLVATSAQSMEVMLEIDAAEVAESFGKGAFVFDAVGFHGGEVFVVLGQRLPGSIEYTLVSLEIASRRFSVIGPLPAINRFGSPR